MLNSTKEKQPKIINTSNNTSTTPTTTKMRQQTRRTNCYYKIGANVPARLVLYFLSWSGFLVSFMMRNDINFALVAMTHSSEAANDASQRHQHAFVPEQSGLSGDGNYTVGIADTMQADEWSKNISSTTVDVFINGTYDWSSTVKSVIVSSFYWCYVLSQVVGGIATQFYGTKHVFGWSQFATALCSICIPKAADIHYSVVIALRSIQGFASGLTWPAMYALVGYWIPLSERSRFMSSFQGFSIGIGLTYPLCGVIINQFGWPYVFYTTGSLGLLWCLMWYLYAFNTPSEHPRISAGELNYIERNISAELESMKNQSQIPVPWGAIFCSKAAWAIAITTFGRIWIHYIFIVCGPNFMQYILQFEYEKNGFLSGLPFICSYISSVLFCYAADKLVSHKCLSLTQVRKLCTGLSQIVPAILIYWIGYIDDNITLLLVLWFVAVIFITASYAGAMASIVDIAPNFAAPVLAFCQTIHMSASFLSPLVAGLIVVQPSSIEQWRTVFGISTIITIGTYLVFQIWGTAEIQLWNYVHIVPSSSVLAEPQEIQVGNDGKKCSSAVNSDEEEAEREPLQIIGNNTESSLRYL